MGGNQIIMPEKTRFGVLSFAHYHGNFWAEAMNESPDAELVGVWDDNPQRGQTGAEKYNTRFFADLNALLAECDAVGITSETSKHVDLVEAAAAAGCHILLEKPMALNLAECKQIQAAVAKASVTFMQNFPKRYDPVNHELVELVQSGALGKIAVVRIRHANFHLLDLGQTAAEQWFGNPALSGGGSLLDEGIHAADFLLWMLGMPQQVFAMISNSTLGLPLDDTGLAIFNYANGTLAEITSSGTLVAAEESIEVYGTEGSAILSGVDLASRDFSKTPYLKVYQRDKERGEWQGSPTVPYFGQGNFHQQGPLHFLKCLRGEAEPVITLDEGWKSLAMIKAAYRAVETGQVQTVQATL
jgi:predicted dehydrogenase